MTTLDADDSAEIDAIAHGADRAAQRIPRGILVGIIPARALTQFGALTAQASAAGLSFCILNIAGLGLRRLPQIALTCFVVAVALWLHIPVIERACNAIDRLLTASCA